MFISEFSKFHHIDYLRILTSIRTMRDETKDKLIHNSLFSSEFSKFHPWIIRPYISTSIHSFCNLSIKQRIRKVDSLISYFSEFSNFRSFFFLILNLWKKKDKLQSLPLLSILQISSLLNHYSSLFIPTNVHSPQIARQRMAKVDSLRFHISVNFPSLISRLISRFLTNTMKHRGGKVDSLRFHVPIPLCCTPLSKTWKTGGIIIGNDPRRNADMLHLFEHCAAEFNLGL